MVRLWARFTLKICDGCARQPGPADNSSPKASRAPAPGSPFRRRMLALCFAARAIVSRSMVAAARLARSSMEDVSSSWPQSQHFIGLPNRRSFRRTTPRSPRRNPRYARHTVGRSDTGTSWRYPYRRNDIHRCRCWQPPDTSFHISPRLLSTQSSRDWRIT